MSVPFLCAGGGFHSRIDGRFDSGMGGVFVDSGFGDRFDSGMGLRFDSGIGGGFDSGMGGGFDSWAFMDKFSERFLDDVDSHAIVLGLVINKIISGGVARIIKHCTIGRGNAELLLHLKNYASPNSISKLCDVMRSIAGYPKMSELGRAMKEELDLLTSKCSCVEIWSDPVRMGFRNVQYNTLWSVCIHVLFISVSLNPLLVQYLSTYSLHVLVYMLTTCTCLHAHYMHLSTYSLHVLVYMFTIVTCTVLFIKKLNDIGRSSVDRQLTDR